MARAVSDGDLRARLDKAIGHALATRADRVCERPDWEALRDEAAHARRAALRHLPRLVEEFEGAARAAGTGVHFARTAGEARRVIAGLVGRPRAALVKSKSMVTEEIDLRPYLAARGVSVIETDLGEYIVQLAGEKPSHIVAPVIHMSAGDIARVFNAKLGLGLAEDADPRTISLAAREHLRPRFLEAEVGMCGANLVAAREGAAVVCTNEGNGALSTCLPERLVVVTGIEKLMPTLASLAPLLLLLGSSATGQRQTCYTHAIRGPSGADGVGPRAVDVVLVDSGRSAMLAHPVLWEALACIRCGACMHVCPIYTRTGGQAYGWIYPGPIGIAISGHIGGCGERRIADACTLCGACAEICPVRIALPDCILEVRRLRVEGRSLLKRELSAWLGSAAFRKPWLWQQGGRELRAALRKGRRPRRGPGAAWTSVHEPPRAPDASFSELWRREERRDG